MKKIILLSFFLSLFFFIKVNAQIVASLELSSPPVENNLTHFTVTDPNNEPYTIQTVIDGVQCRQIPGTKYGYFNAGSVISTTDNNLIFHITFYDQGKDNLSFQYNATNSVNYKNITISKTATNRWITATIAITDASFRNAQNNNCDFRLGTDKGFNNYIKSISIEKGTFNPATEPIPTTSASSYSEFIGKSVAGYQVWFKTGTPTAGWFHWSGTTQPSVGHLNFEVYPDVADYNVADLTQSGFANLGNGSPSQLFNSANKSVIDIHFSWMNANGIDGVALQRFINGIGSVVVNSQDASPVLVKNAAESNKRIFYICYDISSTGLDATWADIIKFDWVYNIEQNYKLTASPAYAKVGNKPVVEVWGTGFTGNHPGTAQETIDLINFLKSRGCYVIGGVPTNWRNPTAGSDSQLGFDAAYKTYDMISPWSVGRFGDINGVNSFKTNFLIPDKNYADQNGLAYMPVIFPGFSWSQWNNGTPNMIPRLAGKFSWQQALNIKSIGINSMYFAMFDEYDEGTAIMKAATDWTMIPTNQYFVTLSNDGTWLSSDFYLRLAGASIEMLKGTRPQTADVPIVYSNGPIYYRNSFEKRYAKYDVGNGYFNVDPCFFNPTVLSNSGVSNASVTIEKDSLSAHSGIFTSHITGASASATNAVYYYKIADTKIPVKNNMSYSFWKYTVNDFGRYTSVDLMFKSGKVLRNLSAYVDQTGIGMHPENGRGTVGAWDKFTCQIGKDELVGDTISGIIIAYDHPAASGVFTAYFDDILIEDDNSSTNISKINNEISSANIIVNRDQIIIKNLSYNSSIKIYNCAGQLIKKIDTSNPEIQFHLSQGLYVININSRGESKSKKVFVD